MNATFTKAEMKQLRQDIKAIEERVERTIGQANGMLPMEFCCYQQLKMALFNAASLAHQFWNVANEK